MWQFAVWQLSVKKGRQRTLVQLVLDPERTQNTGFELLELHPAVVHLAAYAPRWLTNST